MELKDCLPNGAGTCRNEAMIDELLTAREADWRKFVELTHDEQIAELERRWQEAEAEARRLREAILRAAIEITPVAVELQERHQSGHYYRCASSILVSVNEMVSLIDTKEE